MTDSISTASRRSFLAGAATLVAAPMVLGSRRAAAKSDSVTIVNFGGSYQEATIKAVIDPFTKETGIKVSIVPYPGLDKIKAMQLTGNVDIDILLGGGSTLASGSRRGFLEKLDHSLFDLQDLLIQPKSDYVVFEVYSQGVAWDPAKHVDKRPATFVDFFDRKNFPGRRCFNKTSPANTMEIALLGDGVAPKDVYPLDVDRAFKVLDRIKSSVVWAGTVTQVTSFVQTGEVDFSAAFGNRVKATTEPGGGKPLAFSFEQNTINSDCLGILKGAPNKENATKLIAYYLRPEVQARLYNLVGLTPGSKKAATMLSGEARKWLPDLNNPANHVIDDDYWADNFEAINLRFQEWLLT
ncbi:ABC transporter substrate-binding protein [Bradyrhizobium sp. 183]|uniref:ABC transporter substrate-binding protein n=1 Tax=unclassified Bradyrhizobium TaxID=2631580 RepID=UPI001FFEB37D|nr:MULTISPECIES: ABC transporter substrate-binding protein [unclassified Bradyrhizobium]UPJ79332.1 ABC transporter substrate-binding protein [Bradyrhizobium sp. 184]UPJ87126.1 ABC transporter substrate-binding protein [Bradyrhizobium sp. 183]